jgi:hypothetical protein
MSASNAWAEFSGLFRRTRAAYLDHERAKGELKALMPEDAKEAIGHGVRGRKSKAGAISFEALAVEGVERIGMTKASDGDHPLADRKTDEPKSNGGGDDAARQ